MWHLAWSSFSFGRWQVDLTSFYFKFEEKKIGEVVGVGLGTVFLNGNRETES